MPEIKYPQRIRGGAGYFPSEGTAVIQGSMGAKLVISGQGNPDPSVPVSQLVMREGALDIVWKRAGSTAHPTLAMQNLEDAHYSQIGDPAVGFITRIDFTIEILNPAFLGSGGEGKGWYFYPALDVLKPDFEKGSSQSTGTFQLWVNDRSFDFVGGSKWSKNVGSGIDGILLTLNDGDQPISEFWPRKWPKGSKIRVGISYWVPA